MKSNFKPSLSSRASIRVLIVACLPTAAMAFVANSPVLGAAFNESTNQDLTVDDNTFWSTNRPSTNVPGTNHSDSTNGSAGPFVVEGVRG